MSSLADHIETIDLYVEHGCEPGSCTTAILAGDLFGALGRADPTTEQNLGVIARYIVNHTPRACWGSYAAVEQWIKEKRATAKYAALREEAQREEARREGKG